MNDPFFYSFDRGLVHVVSLGSEDNPTNAYESLPDKRKPLPPALQRRWEAHYGPNSDQYRWLDRDLRAANAQRDKVPWILVFTHRPVWHSSGHHPMCQEGGDWFGCRFRELYTQLFERYGVNIFVAGHSHHYSRSQPLVGTKVVPGGPIYMVCGTGGYELTRTGGRGPKWVAYRQGSKFGHCMMEVFNATHLRWNFVAAANGEVMDDVMLTREAR